MQKTVMGGPRKRKGAWLATWLTIYACVVWCPMALFMVSGEMSLPTGFNATAVPWAAQMFPFMFVHILPSVFLADRIEKGIQAMDVREISSIHQLALRSGSVINAWLAGIFIPLSAVANMVDGVDLNEWIETLFIVATLTIPVWIGGLAGAWVYHLATIRDVEV